MGANERETERKIERIKEILRDLGLECARTIEERVDLQFDALKYLHQNLNDTELFLKLVIANSLVSYQLSGRGEDWWWEFAKHFSEKKPEESIVKAYSEFLPASRTNKRLTEGKIKRLKKAEGFLERLTLEELEGYYFGGMTSLREELARALNSRKDAKTVVFAVKMFGYGGRIAFGRFVPYPMEIEIPDDVRINAYTKRFTKEPSSQFWSRIAREVNIPPLHIDSILWPALGEIPEVKIRLRKYCRDWTKVVELTNL